MTVNEKIYALRKVMKENDLDAYIINGTDPHQSEYVSECWQTRAFISGFTGSAGTVIITQYDAYIWVDSRYFIQCELEIKDTEFRMKKIDGTEAETINDYLKSLGSDKSIGISAETITISEIKEYEKEGIKIKPVPDLLNIIWENRPAIPCFPVIKLSDKLCGKSVKEKIEDLRKKIKSVNADCTLISSLDDIAWILNLRGSDINNCPVFISYLFIDENNAILYTSLEHFKKIKTENLLYKIEDYNNISDKLSNLNSCSIYLNPEKTNMYLYSKINKDNVKIIFGNDYSTLMKACKNTSEIEGMINAHIQDGAAMVNFLSEVYSTYTSEKYNELSLAKLLEEKRKKSKDYINPSFDTISAYKEHGAIVHYSATAQTNKDISGNGLLVLDSGGQYKMGTTDITRTLLFGKATKEQKIDYTLVLKGHLALTKQCFPQKTTGLQLDILAHQFLWNQGLNYYHGTGHGVGCRLNVHEGPQRISSHANAGKVALEEGMIISNEPGLYKEGKHGIRIENLIYVTSYMETDFGKFYKFNTLTCCPYEKKLILKEMLTAEEIEQINTYHTWVYRQLKNLVDKTSLPYLRESTLPL